MANGVALLEGRFHRLRGGGKSDCPTPGIRGAALHGSTSWKGFSENCVGGLARKPFAIPEEVLVVLSSFNVMLRHDCTDRRLQRLPGAERQHAADT